MRFLVSEIRDAGVVEREEQIEPGDLLGDPPRFVSFPKPIRIRAQAHFAETEIVVSGTVQTEATLTCGRCLESFSRPCRVRIDPVFETTLEEIDLSEEIREAILIDLPLAAVCRETCKGICPACGVNRNQIECECEKQKTDPRWDSLKSFPFK